MHSPFPTAPLKTARDSFDVKQLASGHIDGQLQFGSAHLAYRMAVVHPTTCRASPCEWLSHSLWCDVTRTTAMLVSVSLAVLAAWVTTIPFDVCFVVLFPSSRGTLPPSHNGTWLHKLHALAVFPRQSHLSTYPTPLTIPLACRSQVVHSRVLDR